MSAMNFILNKGNRILINTFFRNFDIGSGTVQTNKKKKIRNTLKPYSYQQTM